MGALRSTADAREYITKDGSLIRELVHPSFMKVSNLSLAVARVKPGYSTLRHRHMKSEEIYYILSGSGVVYAGDSEFHVSPGDAVHIPAGEPHHMKNTCSEDLVLLCACSPAYSHSDTLLE